MIADTVDRLSALADRAEGYPGWARLLFGVTLVLVLCSLFVFIALYPRGGES
jgi:hypothetical protein